ncbi:ATP-grasp domain-containing protein [Micromonospora echinospora]|uniref:ATP-grasp domain-containing protein n=1 Tax=Micromonospora echinospora TaxID=1877 RepID=UPI003406029D
MTQTAPIGDRTVVRRAQPVRVLQASAKIALGPPVGPHPDTPDRPPATDPDLTTLAPLVAPGPPFVTVALARRDDGVRRVVELANRQITDRPTPDPRRSWTCGT